MGVENCPCKSFNLQEMASIRKNGLTLHDPPCPILTLTLSYPSKLHNPLNVLVLISGNLEFLVISKANNYIWGTLGPYGFLLELPILTSLMDKFKGTFLMPQGHLSPSNFIGVFHIKHFQVQVGRLILNDKLFQVLHSFVVG